MFSSQKLADWLGFIEQNHPKAWDLGLTRVRAVAARMGLPTSELGGLQLPVPLITVAGTNGKGSTCAMLESIYAQAGYKVATHTSPHLMKFEERLRFNGVNVEAHALIEPFHAVECARLGEQACDEITLTYFEFSLLAIVQTALNAHAEGELDVIILEVGLGGRLDAVNIFDADCAIITSIDLDHTEYLGSTREAIALEKAHIMRAGRPAIVSDPVAPSTISSHAQAVGAALWLAGHDFNVSGDKQQWAWACSAAKGGRRYGGLGYPALRGANQLMNAAGVLAALEALRKQLPVSAQAIRNGFAFVELAGRFQLVPGQPTVVLDVAHNPHSVAALAENLDAMGFFPRTHAVFGAMADKDLNAMLTRIAPLVDHWYLCDLPTPRAASASALAERIKPMLPAQSSRPVKSNLIATTPINPETKGQIDHKSGDLKPIQASVSPPPASQCFGLALDAFAAALSAADAADRIVVFGSFLTVGAVIEHGLPQLSAKHLPSARG